MRMHKRDPDVGVVLVNVLVIIALASAMVYLMLESEDVSLDRVARLADATQVEFLALGAEASVLDALRQDLNEHPDEDHFAEPWTSVIQQETVLSTGRFSVAVTDVQGKYDINFLSGTGLGPVEVLARLLAATDQPVELAPRLAALVRRVYPVGDLQDLASFGVAKPVLDALAPYVTAYPAPGTVNLNSADPVLLEAMLNNRSIALRLVSARTRKGFITREDLVSAGGLRPENSGWTSNTFDVAVLAEVGRARLQLETRILRFQGLDTKSIGIVSRRIVTDDVPQEALGN